MPKPSDWNAILAPEQPYQEAYRQVADQARHILTMFPSHNGQPYSTVALCEALYPLKFAIGELGLARRQRMFKALLYLATHDLADCATRAPEKVWKFGKHHQPWLWHSPTTPNDECADRKLVMCPHCGGEIWS